MEPPARDITVCICTHNRPRYVRDCLKGLQRQTEPADGFAVLVVDSGSTGAERHELAELVAAYPGARLIRLERSGVSLARNAGAWAARTPWIAYLDDDAIPAPDWIACIRAALRDSPRPALIGGRILPLWEAPLPSWWPRSLRGVLSIIEAEGRGEYRTRAVPSGLEPYAANMVVHVLSLLAIGGFGADLGRHGGALLSDEEVQVAWKLQDAGHSARYDGRITVHHQIQAGRLTPEWLMRRQFWQGASTVVTLRMLGRAGAVWRALPRRLLVMSLCAPAALLSASSTRCIGARWRFAYALGFVRAACGWRPAPAAARLGAASAAAPPSALLHAEARYSPASPSLQRDDAALSGRA
ncbi:MAG: glycosyltransferase [Rhodospirillales bacterium]|nr:glycosyltransferase [Rhodospirillales bacterium]